MSDPESQSGQAQVNRRMTHARIIMSHVTKGNI